MKVLFVTTEMDDFVRVGGLAAVSAALPRALRPWADVRVLLPGLPRHRRTTHPYPDCWRMRRAGGDAGLPARACCDQGWPAGLCAVLPTTLRPAGQPLWRRAGRDWPDNDIRFGRLASAAAELAAGTLDKNWAADLVHANDWQAALVPAYLAWNGARLPSILTIHNLAYQGLFPRDSLRRIGAPEAPSISTALEFYDKLSFLKGGLVYASHLTTVSANYAKEITTPEFGCGLEGLLRTPLGRRAAHGHPERHRRKLGPAPLRPACATLRRRRLGRQARQRRLCAQAIRACGLARADFRAGGAAGAPEGHRPRAVGRRRDHRGTAARSSSPAPASPRSSRRWSMRTGAGPTRSGSRSASTTARRGAFSRAAISR